MGQEYFAAIAPSFYCDERRILGKPGVETKAARDVAAHVTAPAAPK